MREALVTIIEQLLLAGIVGGIALGVRQLQAISQELRDLQLSLAGIVQKVQDHDRRLDQLEERLEN